MRDKPLLVSPLEAVPCPGDGGPRRSAEWEGCRPREAGSDWEGERHQKPRSSDDL